MFPPFIRPLGSICVMAFVVPTRYARSASARESAGLENMAGAPFPASAEAATEPPAETAEDAPELGAPAARLAAAVDNRLAQDLGFWGT